jgi:ATP adenylyltransferase
MSSLYYLGNARSDEQLAEMQRLERRGECVFCPEQLGRDSDQPVVLRSEKWAAVENRYPYQGASRHLLLVPAAHESDLLDLDYDTRVDFWSMLESVRTTFGLRYYGMGARNGDPRFTGGTVVHVHVHVIVGDAESDPFVPVRLKLSSRPSDLNGPR